MFSILGAHGNAGLWGTFSLLPTPAPAQESEKPPAATPSIHSEEQMQGQTWLLLQTWRCFDIQRSPDTGEDLDAAPDLEACPPPAVVPLPAAAAPSAAPEQWLV